MKPVQPEELSALLDNELEIARANEVQLQIANNAQLRDEFEQLSQTDARWRSTAYSMEFMPRVNLPNNSQTGYRFFSALIALFCGLIFLRVAQKFIESLLLAFGLHAVFLAVLIGVIFLMVNDDEKIFH